MIKYSKILGISREKWISIWKKGGKQTRSRPPKSTCFISYLQAGKENIIKILNQDKDKNIKLECEGTEQKTQKVDFKTKVIKGTMGS